jgi:hypothetical protein
MCVSFSRFDHFIWKFCRFSVENAVGVIPSSEPRPRSQSSGRCCCCRPPISTGRTKLSGQEPWTAVGGGVLRRGQGVWPAGRHPAGCVGCGLRNNGQMVRRRRAAAAGGLRERVFVLAGAGAGNVADPILQTGTKWGGPSLQRDSRRPGKQSNLFPVAKPSRERKGGWWKLAWNKLPQPWPRGRVY